MKTWDRRLKYWPVAVLAAAAAVASAQSVPSTGYSYDNNGNLHRTAITPYDPTCDAFVTTKEMCGSCSNRCNPPANGQATCSWSCTSTSCGGTCGFTCNSGYAACYGRCVDFKTDDYNCGSCGNVCAGILWGSGKCTNGTCAYTCDAGTKYTAPAAGTCTTCGTRCVYLQSDPRNCGSCGRTCPTIANGYQKCVAGQCKYDCKDGFTYTGP